MIGTEGALKAALSRGRIDVLKGSRPGEPGLAGTAAAAGGDG